jgi:glycosyltransferase involved in cell wall biosynthesis
MDMDDFQCSIDVVIPVFNGSRTISNAIRSIESQSFRGKITIYAVDDYSTDDSVRVLENLKKDNENLYITKNSKNLGNAVSRNIGSKLGNSSYVSFLDQDDIWMTNKLELQIEAANAEPEVGYIVGMQQFKLLNTSIIPRWFNSEWLKSPQPGYLPSTLIVRRSILNLIGGFSEDLLIASDTDWFARARRMKIPYTLLPEVLVEREIHSDNLSASTSSNLDYLKLLRVHLETENE